MPFYRKPRNFTPLRVLAEKKSIKNGVHNAIFDSHFGKYVGDWKNELKNGYGFYFTHTNKLYQGQWHKGFRHGFGTLSYCLGNGIYWLEYRGDWVRGKPEGIGWWWYRNGDRYIGFFKNGKRHGFGKMWYADGTFYVGYWNMNKKEGLGMHIYENGNRYEGNWEANLKSGYGRYYHMQTGQMQVGCWEAGMCVISKMVDIIIRQFCVMPSQYPIHLVELQNPEILKESKMWLEAKLGDIDKQLQKCLDKMN